MRRRLQIEIKALTGTVLFPDLFDKPLVATFNRGQASSDAGGVLLKAAERVYGLVKAFAGCLADKRAPEKIRHTLAELLGQRISSSNPSGSSVPASARSRSFIAAGTVSEASNRAHGVSGAW